jgi:serpin B
VVTIRIVGLTLVGVLGIGCVAGVPESPAGRPFATLAPATAGTPSSPPATATQSPGGGIGDFAAIEGAQLLVRGQRDPAPAVDDEAVRALARANAGFALDLYGQLATSTEGNIVLGPHSISSALSMIYAGARGETAREMADVLHFDTLTADFAPSFNALDLALRSRAQDGVVDLRLANQVFSAPGLPLVESYLATLSRDFGAPLAELDFREPEQARQVINDWAADRTNDRITELFPFGAITPLTALVVVNAVSLDAAWRYRFDAAATTDEPFHLPDGSTVEVPTMHFDLYLPLVSTDAYAAVELPYGAGDLSMVVILPADMEAFAGDITAERLESIFEAISEDGIHLSLPKFTFKSHVDLDVTLLGLGMELVYGTSADLSGMSPVPGLVLDTVQHEAFIEVDEAGTEAHAATGGAVAGSHGPTITLDRPFFFVIRDRPTGAILFLGRVSDPRG